MIYAGQTKGSLMKLKEFFQSSKRLTAAIALSCFLLTGMAGLKLASNDYQEAPAYTELADEVAFLGPIRNIIPQGNFWSG